MTAISLTSRRGEATGTQTAFGFERILLCCGILSTLLYVAMNVLLARQSPGYSSISQTISELSAIGAPTRSTWLIPGIAYTVLAIAFGCGVSRAAGENRKLHVAGIALLCFGALGLFWPFAPMHQRVVLASGGATLTDTAHIALGSVSVVAMLVAVVFAGTALGPGFGFYSLATLATVVVFGAATGMNAPRISANLPTPWVGLWERISIGAFMLWEVVLTVKLLRTRATHPQLRMGAQANESERVRQ